MSENKNVLTLDDIVQAADRKFANLVIDLPETGRVTLVNAMQLSKADRVRLMASQKEANALKEQAEEGDEAAEAVEVDQVEKLEEILRIIVRGENKTEALIEALDHNLARLATVFEFYSKGTELGEASASAS